MNSNKASLAMQRIAKLVDENSFMEMLIGDNVDWEYFLEGVKESLTWLLANNEGFKNWVGNRHVATGFDDGDLILLK